MGYLESSDAELIALTRLRREEARARLTIPQPVRYSASKSVEFVPTITLPSAGNARRRSSYRSWRTGQFHAGNRSCYYCDVQMVLPPRKQPNGYVCSPITATVDHRIPLARLGSDDPSNWVMCCARCNNRKGYMSENEFRALMVREAALAIAAE